MFGSQRSWLARYIGPLLVFLSEMGSCLSWSISLFFPKQLHAALILTYVSSLVVSLRCVVCLRYLNSVTFFNFFADLLVYLRCPHGLSCTLSFRCVFLNQLSGFVSLSQLSGFLSLDTESSLTNSK